MALLESDGLWLGACVTPWAVATHPNFTPKSKPSPGQMLALLSEFRIAEFDRYYDKSVHDDGAGQALVRAARESMTTSGRTIPDVLESVDLVDASLGILGAHSLYLSRAYAWNGQEDRAVQQPEALAEKLIGTSGSGLWRAVLFTTAAHRALDLGDKAWAAECVNKATSALDGADVNDFKEFDSSPGVDWDYKSVLLDCKENTADLLRRATASLELGSGIWMDIIRSRGSWPQKRRLQLLYSRDSDLRESLFDRATNSQDRTVRWSNRATTHDEALAAMLAAELAGSYQDWRSSREALGQSSYLLDDTSREDVAAEILWTFWLARADKELRRSVDEFRARGPLTALTEVASRTLSTERVARHAVGIDFDLWRRVVDLVEPETLKRIWAVCHAQLTEEWLVAADFSAMQALARCLDATIRILHPEDFERRILELIHSLLASLSIVPPGLDHMWSQVLEGIDPKAWGVYEGGPELLSLLEKYEIDVDVVSASNGDGGPQDIAGVARMLRFDEYQDDQLSRAQDLVQRRLEQAVAGSHKGYSIGGYDEGVLAVYLLRVRWQESLWAALLQYVSDPRLGLEARGRALEMLTRRPFPEAKGITHSASGAMSPDREQSMFGDGIWRNYSLQGLAFARVHGLIDDTFLRNQTVDAVMRGDSRVRHQLAQAFGNIAWGIPGVAGWVPDVLRVLSYDRDALVRAEVAFAWPSRLLVDGADETALFETSRALGEEGVRVPLLALHGLQYLQSQGGAVPSTIMESVRHLAADAPSAILCGAAVVILGDGNV